MNDEQLNKLFAAARRARPDTQRAELAFETRLLARLRPAPAPPLLAWFAWAWRLAPLLAAVVLGLGIWNFVSPSHSVAELGSAGEDMLLVSLLAGEEWR